MDVSNLRKAAGIDFSKCVNFNQATSVVSYTTPAALQSTTNDYAYFQYFNARTIDTTARRLIDQTNDGLLVILTSNGIQVQARHASTNGQVIIPRAVISLNEWQSLVVNWSNTMSYPEVYFNGQLYATSPTVKSGARQAAGATTYLGNRAGLDRQFDGLLDKHAFLSRLAVPAEIAVFRQRGTLPGTALVAYEMNEASGSLTDASGNSVTGTASNVTQNTTGFSIPARTLAGTRTLAGSRTSV